MYLTLALRRKSITPEEMAAELLTKDTQGFAGASERDLRSLELTGPCCGSPDSSTSTAFPRVHNLSD